MIRVPSEYHPGEALPVVKPKPKPKPKPVAPPAPPGVGEANKPDMVLPGGPPVRPLQQVGIHIDMPTANDRVQQITDAHQKRFGRVPTSGLVFDLMRSWDKLGGMTLDNLFDIPDSMRAAKTKRDARLHGVGDLAEIPVDQDEDEVFFQQLATAGNSGELPAFIAQHHERFYQMLADPLMRQRLTRTYLKAQTIQAQSALPSPQQIARAGSEFAAVVNDNKFLRPLWKAYQIGALGTLQISTGITAGPVVFAAAEATALYKATGGVGGPQEADPLELGRVNYELAKTVAAQTYHDVKAVVTGDTEYLAQNPGNVFLSWYGLLSFGAGGVARFSAGMNEASFLRGFTAPHLPGTATMRHGEKGEVQVERLRFENPLLRAADDLTQDMRSRRAARGEEPLGAAGLRAFGMRRAADTVSRHLSYQSKFKRELLAQRRTELIAGMQLANDLQAIAGPTVQLAEAFTRMPRKVRKGLRVDEMKAMWVITKAGPESWREALDVSYATHLGWRDAAAEIEAHDIAKAHEGQAALLKAAKPVLEAWEQGEARPEFVKALDLLYETLDETTDVKVVKLGMAPETAEFANALEWDVLKTGEAIPDRKRLAGLIKNLEPGVANHPSADTFIGLQNELSDIEAQLFAARRSHKPTRALIDRKNKLNNQVADLLDGDFGKKMNQVDALKDTLAEAERRVREAEIRPGMRRTPSVPVYKSDSWQQFTSMGDAFTRKPGRFGEGPPGLPSNMTHAYTGRALISGSTRIDIPTLAAGDLARAVRAVARLEDYSMKLASADKARPSGPQQIFFYPIRTGTEVDKAFRGLLAKTGTPDITEAEIAGFTDVEIEAINGIVYPSVEEALRGDIPDVKWYDIRAFPEFKTPPDPKSSSRVAANKFYSYFGRPKIYLAPRYMLNTVSNKFMRLLNTPDGPALTVKSYTAAYHAEEIYGERAASMIAEMTGSSRSRSYAPLEDTGWAEHKLIELSDWWHVVTDKRDRMAAFIGRAWDLGYTTAGDMNYLLFGEKEGQELSRAVKDDAARKKDLNEVKRRSNKELVEIDNLSWNEQHYLRHFLFVYPWRSRQFVWSVRTIAEHPMRMQILNAIGQDSQNELLDEATPWLANSLDHYRRLGYMITGWDEKGNPKIMNIGTLNTLSGINDFMNFDASSSMGPGWEFLIRGFTSSDGYGNKYGGNEVEQWGQAFLDVAAGLPQILAYKRGKQEQKDLPPIDWGDKRTLVTRLNAAADRIALSPGWLAGFGILLTGGLTVRSSDKYKLWSRWYKGLEPEERHDYEMTLIRFVMDKQAQLMKKPVPGEVRQAVEILGKVSWEEKLFQQEHGVDDLPALERDYALIRVLEREGLISQQDAERQNKLALGRGPDPKDHDMYRANLVNRVAHGIALRVWDEQINQVASYVEPSFREKVRKLFVNDLAPQKIYPGKQATLYDLGRRVVEYETELDRRRAEANLLSGADQDAAHALIRVWIADQDHPVKLGSRSYPSVVRLSYIDASEQERVRQRREMSVRSWGTMSPFDKAILGQPGTRAAANGWANLQVWLAQANKTLPIGKSLPTGTLQLYADTIGAKNPDFKKEWDFSNQILARRLKVLKPIVDSKYRSNWDELLDEAANRVQWLRDAGWKATDAATMWARTYAAEREEWLKTQPAGFRQEVHFYMRTKKNFIGALGGK